MTRDKTEAATGAGLMGSGLMGAGLRGAGLMAIAMALLPIGDAFATLLSQRAPYPPETLAWIRFAFAACALAPLLLLAPPPATRFFWGAQLLRGGLLAGVVSFILLAYANAPMAEATGAFFIAPIVSSLLAALLLRERLTSARVALLALGLVGVGLVLAPFETLSLGLVYGLIAGALYGAFLTATRWSAAAGPPLAALAVQSIAAALALTPIAAAPAVEIGVREPWLLVAMAAPSLAANLITLLAYRLAGAVALAPVVYVSLISAAACGYVFFGDVPNAQAASGLGLILVAGVAAAALGAARAGGAGAARRPQRAARR